MGGKLPPTMRVLHIYRTYFPETQGGAQESIRQLCLATQTLGVDNTIFALAHQPEPPALGLPEGRLVRAKSWMEIASCDIGAWSAIQRCRAAAAQSDIIQIHYPWPFADLMLPWIRSHKQPVLVTYISDIVRQNDFGLGQLYAPLRRQLLGAAKHIVASSPNYEKSSEVLQQYSHKLSCIPHCMGPAPQVSDASVAHWRARFGTEFFLFVGVLRYYKGLDFLLEAAPHVRAPIVIVGEGPEGDRLRQIAQRNGLTNVHFVGALNDEHKNALIQICRAVVFPSHLRSEAFGMTLLEGARVGRPLISCEIGTGTTWINIDGETGLVVPPADGTALAYAMEKLRQDSALCARLGEGAQRRWEQLFTPQVVGQSYFDLYSDLHGGRTSPAQGAKLG